MVKKIVIITDCTDIAFNELYRTIDGLLQEQRIKDYQIDPLIPIKNFSIENTAFSLKLLAGIYDKDTIFHVVVNGTNFSPNRIFGKLKNGITFVGNNSGYFNWMIEKHGLECLYENRLGRDKDSRSFGGKHVGAPTVAKIVAGETFDNLGFEVPQDYLSDYTISDGTIVHCDNFGLMKIKYEKPIQLKEMQNIKIYVNNQYKLDAIFTQKWKTQQPGTWVLFPGSSLGGIPELGRVRAKNSAIELGVEEGDLITWE